MRQRRYQFSKRNVHNNLESSLTVDAISHAEHFKKKRILVYTNYNASCLLNLSATGKEYDSECHVRRLLEVTSLYAHKKIIKLCVSS